jgi:1-acyl-sn-glycerol-3-phosphate acyltransferase
LQGTGVGGESIKDAYAWIQILVRLLMRAFFRRVEVAGLGNVPQDGGGLLVAWHPNGLIDPGLILSQFNRRVVFGARHGLFSYPLLGHLLRAVGTVPIYRAQDAKGGRNADPEARRAANRKSLEALAQRIVGGNYSALFPEGDSHDESDVQDFKTGAARLYYGARRLVLEGKPVPVIIPVGLYYDDKRVFRSSALVAFYPPLQLPEALDVTPASDPDSPEVHTLCKELTEYLEVELREATFATDSWRLHHLIRRARRLILAERAARSGSRYEGETLGERIVAFAKIRQGYQFFAENDPEGKAELEQAVEEYDSDLRALGLQDEHLDHGPGFPTWIAVLLGLQMVGVFVFLPVLVFFGYLVNLPTAGIVIGLARVLAKKRKDEATIKLLVGAIAFPLTWAAVGVLAALGVWELRVFFPRVPDTPTLAGLSVALLGAIGGAAGIRYWRFARDVARAVRVRLTRRRFRLSVARLRQRRRALHDRLMEVAAMAEVPTRETTGPASP